MLPALAIHSDSPHSESVTPLPETSNSNVSGSVPHSVLVNSAPFAILRTAARFAPNAPVVSRPIGKRGTRMSSLLPSKR